MEKSPNIYTEPMSVRLRRAAGFLFDRFHTPDEPREWRPSAQRDVGKSAARAADVQLVVNGLQRPAPEAVALAESRLKTELNRWVDAGYDDLPPAA